MRVAIIGSGPAGTAAAHVLLERGADVTMFDGGREPDADSDALAATLRERIDAGEPVGPPLRAALKHGPAAADAAGGLRKGLGAVLGGGVDADRIEKRILGSAFTFEDVDAGIPLEHITIPRSLARGGLSNVWGAACYTWRAEDYAHWPVGAADLEPWFARATELLGLVQNDDDLARAYPLAGPTTAAPERNPGSAADHLLHHWQRHGDDLRRAGFAAGRGRVATHAPGDGPDACRRCGLCVYGCPYGAIYSTRRSLPDLERRGLRYVGRTLVEGFEEQGDGVRLRLEGPGGADEARYDAVLLAAGTLGSLRLAADSLALHDRPAPLLDNDMVLLPLVWTGGLVGGDFRSRFTLAEGALALDPGRVADRALHLQLYSFHEYFLAELGSVLAQLPGVVEKAAWSLLNNLLVCFTYTAGSESLIAKGTVRRGQPRGRIEVAQKMHPEQRQIQRRLTRLLWRHRRALGFWPIAPLAKLTPLGFSGHLAGALPMRRHPGPLESHVDGRLEGTRSVYVVDGASFPDLPAQNLTYAIAANAMRIADGLTTSAD